MSSFMHRLSKVLIGILLLFLTEQALAEANVFSIDSQPLSSALTQLAKQGKIAVFAEATLLEGKISAPVYGKYSLLEAASQLLSKSDLFAKQENKNTLIVQKQLAKGFEPTRLETVSAIGSPKLEELIVYSYARLNRWSKKQGVSGNVELLSHEMLSTLPSLNLAEAIQYAAGVVVTHDSGEGRQISMRGLSPSYTQVRINDIEALFTTDSGIDQRGSAVRTRGFDFSIFASDLFEDIHVTKSFDASETEGGIAGTVDLYTPKPFNFEGFQARLSVNGLYNDLAEETSPRISGLVSNNWGDFGALVSLAYSEIDTIERGYHVWSWRQANFGAANISESIDPKVTNRLVNATGSDRVFVSRANNIASWFNYRERLGVTTAFQWQPSSRLQFDVTALFGKLSNDRIENQLSTAGTNAFTGDVFGEQQLTDAVIQEDDLVYAKFENLDLRSESKISYSETRFHQLALNTTFDLSKRLSGRVLVGITDSEFNMPIHDKVFLESTGHSFSVDWREGDYGRNTYGFDLEDPSFWRLMRSDTREDYNSNVFKTGQVDLSWAFSTHFSVDFGIQRKRFDSDGFERRNRLDWEGDSSTPDPVLQRTEIPLLRHFIIADNQQTFARLEETGRISRNLDDSANVAGSVYRVEEDTVALYASLHWQTEWWEFPVTGDIGMRWLRTEQSSREQASSVNQFQAVEHKTAYSYFLPSANVNVSLSPFWVWRSHISRNLSRPDINQLRASATINVADTMIDSGAPDLKAFTVDTFEMALEYFGDSHFLGLAAFHKRLDSFFTQQSLTIPYHETGFPLELLLSDPRVNADSEFTLSKPANGEGVDLTGLELSFSSYFNQLPQPFDGFGVSGNYTYVTGKTQLINEGQIFSVPLPGLSKSAYAVNFFYDADLWGGRISYTFRDAYISGEGASQNVVAGYGETAYIDLRAYYNLTDSSSLTLEGINLTNEPLYQFLDHRPQSYTTSGTVWSVGFELKF